MNNKKKYLIKGWVEVEVYAEIEANSLEHAKRIWKKTQGNGIPDEFDYEEGNWCSSVYLDSIEEVKEQ